MTALKFSARPAVALAIVAGLALAGCQKEGGQAQAQAQHAPPPPTVTVQTVEAKDVPLVYDYPGRLVAYREVEVRARVEGILLEKDFVEGSIVKKGDVLFRIDPVPFEAEVARAKAQLQRAQATLVQAKGDQERAVQLFERKVGTEKARDDAVAAVATGTADVAAAEAQLKTAEINLSYTTVTAPITGVTAQRTLAEGSLVGSSANDSLLTRITQLDPIYVNFSFTDNEATEIRDLVDSGKVVLEDGGKLKVRVTTSNGKTYDRAGVVDFTSRTVDTATGTVLARAEFPNPDNRLLPGQFVRAAISGITLKNTIVIPQAAVMQGPQGTFVYAVGGDNIAQVKPVDLGREVGQGWVVRSGLAPGDRIITEGVIKVRPGSPVTVATAQAVEASAAPAAGAKSTSAN